MALRSIRGGLGVFVLAVAISGCAAPTPTAAPPSPTPARASPNPNLVDFESHLRQATGREGQLVRELAAATTGSNARLGLAARALAGWASEEQAWLDEHPADACYEDAWMTFQSGVRDIAAAATAFLRLADGPSPPNETEGQEAGLTLGTGTSSLSAAAELANQARAACR